MKKFVITLSVLASLNTLANNKVIYGEDGRVHLNNSEVALYKELARSTAAMIASDKLTLKFGGLLTLIEGETLEDSMMVCKDEKFSQVMTAASCSAFLVGPTRIVTAGHCVKDEFSCANVKFVFDFRQDLLGDGEKELYVNSDNVYGCKNIISRALSGVSKNDYALLELDRAVVDRSPLKFRESGRIEANDPLVVIGHPSGLPTIIAAGANVRKNENDFYFSANLDTFGGNSGSAVFNAKTNRVEGILVRGENDYNYDSESNCYRVNNCKDDACLGEEVTRITVIPELVFGMTPEEPKVQLELDLGDNFFSFDLDSDMDDTDNDCNSFGLGVCEEF